VKQLPISTHFDKQKVKSQKQGPRYFQNFTTQKQLLLKNQLLGPTFLVGFCLLEAKEAPKSPTKGTLKRTSHARVGNNAEDN